MPQFDILSWVNQILIFFLFMGCIYHLGMSFFGPVMIRFMTLRYKYYDFLGLKNDLSSLNNVSVSDFFSIKLKNIYSFFN